MDQGVEQRQVKQNWKKQWLQHLKDVADKNKIREKNWKLTRKEKQKKFR